MANNIEKQLKEISERLEQGDKRNLYFGEIYRISEYHVKVPQLQL